MKKRRLLYIILVVLVISFINHWPDFKHGLVDGWNAANSTASNK